MRAYECGAMTFADKALTVLITGSILVVMTGIALAGSYVLAFGVG